MLPNLVILCLLNCVSGALIPDKLFPSKLGEENDMGKDEFDSSINRMNSVIIDRVQELLGEMLNGPHSKKSEIVQRRRDSQKSTESIGLEATKFFCSGNVDEKFWFCNEKCGELSFFQYKLCITYNFAAYLLGCYSGNMECYTVTTNLTNGPEPTNGGGSGGSDCNCDYSSFSSSHTMNKYTGPAQSCGDYKTTGVTDDEIITILKIHNSLRERVANGLETQGAPGPQPGATNMFELKWNCELAEVAQRWAEQCQLGNDIGDDRKICNQDYYVGQNVYKTWSYNAASAWEEAAKEWYSEVKNMPNSLVSSYVSSPANEKYSELKNMPKSLVNSYGLPPNEFVIKHYTQVVWAGTYEIGCGGIHFLEDNVSKIYVCNYGAGGNLLGSQIYESGIAGSNCPNESSSVYQGLCAPPS